MNNNIVTGIDIGGSHITAALIDLDAHSIIRDSLIRHHVNSKGDTGQIIKEWTDAITACKACNAEASNKIGIAMPGPFDYTNGISLIKGLDKFEALYNLNVKELLARPLKIESTDIFMMNDASCFLKGEVFGGAASNCNTAIGITLGTGLGSATYKNGIVYDGALRDVEGLKEIGGFTSYYTSYDPSYHNPPGDLNTMIIGINQPTRIRTVTVMPGDVVIGKLGVVVFVPPHLAEKVVRTSEIVRLRDLFGHERLREGKYTAGQIDARWSDEIEKDFSQWLNAHIDKLPVPKEQVQEYLKERTW